MSLKQFQVEIRGLRPLLMHSAKAADPLSPESKASKAVSKIRQKTDEHHERLAELDWRHSFYHDEAGKPIMTSDCLMGSLVSGAKKLRLKAAAQSGILVMDDVPLIHDHPAGEAATIEDFWNSGGKYIDSRGVRVQSSRIIRYRPRFNVWGCKFTVELEDLDANVFAQIAETAGRSCGIGDYRPRFGQYEILSIEEI